MPELRKVAGAKEFKHRVAAILKNLYKIKEYDLYFSQTATGYYMEYKPNYPESSNGDFIVSQDLNGSISIYGNMNAVVPTVIHYNDISDFALKMKIHKTTI